MTYTTTEELVMRKFLDGEMPFRCARIEVDDGSGYSKQVGYIKAPEDLFVKLVDLIALKGKDKE